MRKGNGMATDLNRENMEGGAGLRPSGAHALSESSAHSGLPIIEVSELDGAFNVYADFSRLAGLSDTPEVTVEFGQQGVVITGGAVQRYVPIPTDGEIERATVMNAGGIVRISVPTAGLGHRWRSIVMW
jgi:hypothetical protein